MKHLPLLCVFLAACFLAPAHGQDAPAPVRPPAGSLVLSGPGPVHDAVMDAFLHLCEPAGARVLIVADRGKTKSTERWLERGASSAVAIDVARADDGALAMAMLNATGVWFESAAEGAREHELLRALLDDVLARGGVVGGNGPGALALAGPGMDGSKRAKKPGFGLLPHSAVQLIGGSASNASGKPTKLVASGDGHVGWQLPRETALVIHQGRRVAAFGTDHVVVRIPAAGDWPERRRLIQAKETFNPLRSIEYEIDLLAWLRSARDRQGPAFPAAKPNAPRVAKGTLVLSGGGKVGDETLEAFIEAAGGPNAAFVCIPSADDFDPGERVKSYSAGKLADAGCEDVVVLHTVDPRRADEDAAFLAALERADGVWIDGGRTYRVMDRFEGTRAHALMHAVLKRGGAFGGSSAGCQVAGEFLLRGNPRTNQELVFDGYTRGLGFLPGVVIDAHFRQRDRQEPLRELANQYEQLLAIGVDEDTAIVVKGSVATVVGPNKVTFYDGANDVQLESGGTYDLVKRK